MTASPAPGWLDGAFAHDAWRGLALADAAFGRPAAALATLERNLAAYRTVGNDLQIGIATGLLVQVLLAYQAEDPAVWRREGMVAERAFARAAAAGHPFPAAHWLASLLLVEGRWDDLRDLASDREPDAPPQAETAVLGLAPLAAARADWDLARVLLAALPNGAATEPGETRFLGSQVLQRLAVVHGARRATTSPPPVPGWRHTIAGSIGPAPCSVARRARCCWAQYHHASGDPVQARTSAEQALSHASDPRQPLALIAAHRFLGMLDTEEQQLDAAEEHLKQSLSLAEACAAPFERALTLLEIAKLRAVQGRVDEARAVLAEVREICEPLEAKPTLERVAALEQQLGSQSEALDA